MSQASCLWSKNTIASDLKIGYWRVQYAIDRAGIQPDLTLTAGRFYGPESRAAIVAEIEDIRAGVEARRKTAAVPA